MDELSDASDNTEQHIASHAVGIKALGRALRDARGTMSQGEAAARWGVPVSTLGAIEQGVDRRYHSQTLARFDAMLGRSANAIYEQTDDPDDEIERLRAEIDARIDQLRVEMREEVRHLARPAGAGDELDALTVSLSAAQARRLPDREVPGVGDPFRVPSSSMNGSQVHLVASTWKCVTGMIPSFPAQRSCPSSRCPWRTVPCEQQCFNLPFT